MARKTRRKRFGRGRRMQFHGSFTSLAEAEGKARRVKDSFVRKIRISKGPQRGVTRYYVLKER